MADQGFKIEVDAKEFMRAVDRFPQVLRNNIQRAGLEASNEVLNTEGLRNYPPATDANMPPSPYYIRGRGMEYKSYNDHRSERYGTQWNTRTRGTIVIIGNRASYAPYLAGTKGKTGDKGQAYHMAAKGWRRIWDVVQEKQGKIKRIYQAWVGRALKSVGLK